jgi:hypothetical protein
MPHEVPIPVYLGLIGSLRGITRFQLQNQTLKGGKVVFTGNGGRKRLQAILDYYNTGKTPPGVMLNPYVMAVGKFTHEMMKDNVDGLRGPDADGYYHGRCPSCKERGGDTGHDHFYANPSTGRVGCFYGCKKKDILQYLTEITVTVPTPTPTKEQSDTLPTDWKAACGFVYSKYDAKHEGQFYLVKGSQGWDTVGGKREGDETPMACFIRETKEEIGVDLRNIKYLGYEPNSKSVLFTAETTQLGMAQSMDSIQDVDLITLEKAKETKVSFRGKRHLAILSKADQLGETLRVKDAQLVSTKRSDATKDKVQTAAIVVGTNEDFLTIQKLTKDGEPGTTYDVDVAELTKFANSFTGFKKGQRITIQEHYEVLGWDLVKDQGDRSITRKYHPYIAALYALGEIVVYKDGSIERRI